jgi:hypothetical protein
VTYSVPRIYAGQSPQWTFPSDSFNPFSTQTIELLDVDGDIGHTLVHYLYTGTYQTLKLQGVSDLSDSTTEYRRACLVYCTARLYELDSLAEHAVQNMKLFEKGLSIFQILKIARDVYPKLLGDEIWFPKYLKTKIEIAFEADITIFAQEQFLNHFGEAASFNKVLVEIIVGILTCKITSTTKKEGKITEGLFGNYASCEALVIEDSAPEESAEECTPPPAPHEDSTAEGSNSQEPDPQADDAWGWSPTTKKGNNEKKTAFEEDIEPGPQADDWYGWASTTRKGNNGKKTAFEEDVEPVTKAGIWGDWAPTTKKGNKEKKTAFEEDVKPVTKAGIWGDWAPTTKKGHNEKKTAFEEDVEPVPQADDWGVWPPTTKKGKKQKKIAVAEDFDLPTLSLLEGLSCERDGSIKNYEGKVVGEVYEGDAAEFRLKMYFCDGNGNVMDYKNNPVGKCRPIAPEGPKKKKMAEPEKKTDEKTADPEPERPSIAVLDGKSMEQQNPEEPEPKPVPGPEEQLALKELILADLYGHRFNDQGEVLNDDGEVIGSLAGEMKKLKAILSVKATCDSEGRVWAKGKQIARINIELVQPEPKPEESETKGLTLESLDGRLID